MRSIEARIAALNEKIYRKKMMQDLPMDVLSNSLYEFAKSLTVEELLSLTDSNGSPLLTQAEAEEMERGSSTA